MSLDLNHIILVSSPRKPPSIHDRQAVLDYYVGSSVLRATEDGWSYQNKQFLHNASPLTNLQAGFEAITGETADA